MALPSLACVAAAAEMRLAGLKGHAIDVDIAELCARHGVPLRGEYTHKNGQVMGRSNELIFKHVKELRDSLTKARAAPARAPSLAALDASHAVPPTALPVTTALCA